MSKKILILLFILVFVSCVSCVDARDLDNATLEVNLDQNDAVQLEAVSEAESLEAEIQDNDSEVLSAASQNDMKSEPRTASSSYLVLDNDADIENIYIDDYVTWIVSVANRGPGTAKNVKVFDQLPDGLKYVKHTTTKGTFNPKTGIWKLGDMLNDTEEFLYITTKAISSGEKINKANLTSDSVNLNKETYEEEEIDVFEKEINHHVSKTPSPEKTLKATGNPISLVLLSLLGCLVAYAGRR